MSTLIEEIEEASQSGEPAKRLAALDVTCSRWWPRIRQALEAGQELESAITASRHCNTEDCPLCAAARRFRAADEGK